jgi:hypothetical protein
MAYPQPRPPNPNNNNYSNQPGQFQRQSQQHHHHQVTLKTTELASSVSTTTTTTTSSSSSGSSVVPSVEALCKVLGQRAAAKDDEDHVRSVVQCGDGLEDELGAKVLRGRMRQEVPSGKKWTLPAPPAAIDEQDYSSGDSSSARFEEMMRKASARRQSKWKEQFDKLANKTRPQKTHLVEEETEGCLEKVVKPLEKKKLMKQIRRNSTSTFSTQLPVEILEKKKKQPPRRHSLFIQRVSDLLPDETGVDDEVFKPRIRLNPSPPPTKGAGDKLDEIRQIKTLESISTLLQESLWSDRVEGLEKLSELSSSSSSSLSLSEPAVFSALSKVVHLATNGCLRNPRTALTRQATSTFREMFVALGPGMDVFLERGLADGLLSKMMDTNAFMKKEVQEALEAMVKSCSPTRVTNQPCIRLSKFDPPNIPPFVSFFLSRWG